MASTQAAIAANRFGLGSRPGELDDIGGDHADWLLAQLAERDPTPDPPTTTTELLRDIQRLQATRNAARREDSDTREETARNYREFIRSNYREQAARRYTLATSSNLPFRERIVHFWTNHFAISSDKQAVTAIVGTFEDEAIRPYVTGRFADMLRAVEQHPGMILYLDNQASSGPGSRASRFASRRGQDRGLNENLAREILELHTLGVDGGYTQTDVTTFAKVITGWSIGARSDRGNDANIGEFVFREQMHEPGAKTILGKRYAENGLREGEAVLDDLARHPSTARFLSEKLARHFVADEPPSSLVDGLAATYLRSDGDLSAVYTALVESGEAWREPLSKFKTPQDYIVSSYRAFDTQPRIPERVLNFLDLLGQRPYTPGSPAGWPDTMAHWDGGDALLKRIDWASSIGRQISDRARPVELGEAILGPVLSDHTKTAVARAESPSQGLTLLLASPEFQRR
ncbi:MAG TPA: DUF1800 domain-containing protein [Gammaproteobacteria bacterium]